MEYGRGGREPLRNGAHCVVTIAFQAELQFGFGVEQCHCQPVAARVSYPAVRHLVPTTAVALAAISARSSTAWRR
jgi:hypothetical protein